MRPEEIRVVTVDVLVIGAGGAGARAAIEVASRGLHCAVACKEQLGRAHTGMAEGGLNVALTENDPRSVPEVHFEDTLAGGAGINNQQLVRTFTREAPDRVHDLERYGVLFDRTAGGHMAQRYSGKQTYPLTVFIGDYAGREIMSALTDEIRRLGIDVYEEVFICELIKSRGQVVGALAVDLATGEFIYFCTRAVILASGGGGRMYRVTTNAASNTGDGYALGLAAGCQLIDMEMVQFHPTGMVHPESWRGVLVTESVRGEGGRLYNSDGERFMVRYLPDRLELGGRDEVARAIFREVQAGRGTAHGGVHLSVTHLPAQQIEERLPNMLRQFLSTGIDLRREPAEVHPTMHHMMGGIRIDVFGRTSVRGLYAAGEVAGGVHGANRLGGNALAECQVFGRRSAIGAAKFAAAHRHIDADESIAQAVARTSTLLMPKPDAVSPHDIERELQSTMWDLVGIMRDEDTLHVALETVQCLQARAKQMGPSTDDPVFNAERLSCLEVRNMVRVAEVIILAALTRTESRGAHFRTDYPRIDTAWERNIVVERIDGALDVRTVPLTISDEQGR